MLQAKIGFAFGIVGLLGLLAGAEPFDPVSAYDSRAVEGFTVRVNRKLLAHPGESEKTLKELEDQLKRVVLALPPGQVKNLRGVCIWVEWANKPGGAAEFHPSQEWLKAHGYNPEKAGAIEIGHAMNFVNWSQNGQPCMILHEMAHAYQFRVLGERHEGIERAYFHAVEQKIYESVEYVHGGKKKAYAATNPKEYFAELTEAYFGKNDFFPFTRAELEKHDPEGYRLMERVWRESEEHGK